LKLGTLKNGSRDGTLVVVRRDLSAYVVADAITPTLQAALDDWAQTAPALQALAVELEEGRTPSIPLDCAQLHAPLPRAYEWIDGSAYINHVELVRKARGAEPPPTLKTDPLIYQGGSGVLLAPTEDIALPNVEWGCDFEAEICVILRDTPRGITAAEAENYIALICLANDVTFRNLIPVELQKGFGFFQSKPATAFSPVAITPDAFGTAWREGRVHLPLKTVHNGTTFGEPEAGPEMHFSFYDLIAHITKTRSFTAGTILGSGTISNRDRTKGSSCLAEARMIEKIETGECTTPFLQVGDTVAISMTDARGENLCGTIAQRVVTA
jgi:fumarylacetoacetate (FAA) hydrolase